MAQISYQSITNSYVRLGQDKCLSLHKKNLLQNRVHLYIIKYIQNTSKRKGRRIQHFLKNGLKVIDETRHIVQLIYLKGWTRYFEHEYIIKLSKKRSCPPSVEYNAEFRSQVSLIQANSDPNCQSRYKQGSQQGFLSTMYSCSTLTEIIFISWYLILSDQK